MASVEENKNFWNNPESWNYFDLGEKWSSEFGNTDILWYSYLYPRIHNFINNSDTLEIAPGTGRITKYVLPLAKSYIGYDLSEYCIDYCKNNYGEMFFLNDGKTFHNTKNESIDFIFSWDSLVHAEKDVLLDYVKESLRCLREDGIAMFHHSNTSKSNYAENNHWRANVSGSEVKDYIIENDGSVLIQEFITWDSENGEYSDCITTFSRKRDFDFIGLNNTHFSIVRKENSRILSKYELIK